jgi:putative endonuclease
MQDIGCLGEQLVAKWLEQNYNLLQQNWRCRWGEIDIIAQDKISQTIAFVEVKTRSSNNWDENGLLAVNSTKQKKIITTASLFLAEYPRLAELPCRFDLALVSHHKCRTREDKYIQKQNLEDIVPVNIGQSITVGQYKLTIKDYLQSVFD